MKILLAPLVLLVLAATAQAAGVAQPVPPPGAAPQLRPTAAGLTCPSATWPLGTRVRFSDDGDKPYVCRTGGWVDEETAASGVTPAGSDNHVQVKSGSNLASGGLLTTTPTPNAVPRADGTGGLAAGWLPNHGSSTAGLLPAGVSTIHGQKTFATGLTLGAGAALLASDTAGIYLLRNSNSPSLFVTQNFGIDNDGSGAAWANGWLGFWATEEMRALAIEADRIPADGTGSWLWEMDDADGVPKARFTAATSTANAIPRAGGDGKLDAGWLPAHAIDHEPGGSDALAASDEGGLEHAGKFVLYNDAGELAGPYAPNSIQVDMDDVEGGALLTALNARPRFLSWPNNPNGDAPCIADDVGRLVLIQTFTEGSVAWLCSHADSAPETQDGRWTPMNEVLLARYGKENVTATGDAQFCLQLFPSGSDNAIACGSSMTSSALIQSGWVARAPGVVTRVVVSEVSTGSSRNGGETCDLDILTGCTAAGGCDAGTVLGTAANFDRDDTSSPNINAVTVQAAEAAWEFDLPDQISARVSGCAAASIVVPIVELYGVLF